MRPPLNPRPPTSASLHFRDAAVPALAGIVGFVVARLVVSPLALGLGVGAIAAIVAVAAQHLRGARPSTSSTMPPSSSPLIAEEDLRPHFGRSYARKSAPSSASRGVPVVVAGSGSTRRSAESQALVATVQKAGSLVDVLRMAGVNTLLSTGNKVLAPTTEQPVEIVISDDLAGRGVDGVQQAMSSVDSLLGYLQTGKPAAGTGGKGWQVISSNTDGSGHWTAVIAAGNHTFSLRSASPEAFKAAVRGTTRDTMHVSNAQTLTLGRDLGSPIAAGR